MIDTNHGQTEGDYIHSIRETKFIFTTCWMQDGYYIGPKYYKDRIPSTTVTGRVWEAFAVGAVLITNNNSTLNEFGFFPGKHFIDFSQSNNLSDLEYLIANEQLCAQIAARGQNSFLGFCQS